MPILPGMYRIPRLDIHKDGFAAVHAWLILVEGGESRDPDDRGGLTKYGISQKQYPDLDIAALAFEQALALYKRDYWDAHQCARLPKLVGLCLFDAVVQHNPVKAKKLIQQGLNVKADGVIGPKTRAAAEQATVASFLSRHLSYRAMYYVSLAINRPQQKKFLRGWLRRLFLLSNYVTHHEKIS